jgi:hypothetical protein
LALYLGFLCCWRIFCKGYGVKISPIIWIFLKYKLNLQTESESANAFGCSAVF